MASCVVTRNGGSETVVLPASWRKSNHVKSGDILEIDSTVAGQITFKVPLGKNRAEAATEFISFIDSLPRKPWAGTGEPADDKRLIGQRYE